MKPSLMTKAAVDLLHRGLSRDQRVREQQMADMKPIRVTLFLTDWREVLAAIEREAQVPGGTLLGHGAADVTAKPSDK